MYRTQKTQLGTRDRNSRERNPKEKNRASQENGARTHTQRAGAKNRDIFFRTISFFSGPSLSEIGIRFRESFRDTPTHGFPSFPIRPFSFSRKKPTLPSSLFIVGPSRLGFGSPDIRLLWLLSSVLPFFPSLIHVLLFVRFYLNHLHPLFRSVSFT